MAAPAIPTDIDLSLFPEFRAFPSQALRYPEFRYMGSKHRLLPWIHSALSTLKFETAADPFCGSGCVSYLLKAMGKKVYASDFLNFPTVIATALTVNQSTVISPDETNELLCPGSAPTSFIENTFRGIFFQPEDLRFLDLVWQRLDEMQDEMKKSLVITALIRSAMKRQPRGVFTFANQADGSQRYDDGRRDVRISLKDHVREQINLLNQVVFSGDLLCTSNRRDALDHPVEPPDLVYFDPPYVPRADDNCYMKRYHFLEGLSCYWRGVQIMETSKVRKIPKLRTPFSYQSTAIEAFETLFRSYADSTIVLSYSSNGFPDRPVLEQLLRKFKSRIEVFEKPHRYHFGTHSAVTRANVTEYLLVGQD